MVPHDLEELVAGGETYTVEFKRDANDDELTEAVVCLANGDGGWLLIGVEDDGTIIGASPRHGSTTQGPRVEALVANRTSPPLNVQVSVEQLDGVDIVVVRVPKPQSVVATTSGRYVRRAIDVDGKPQCLPMLPHETQARTSSLGVRDLSTLPLSDLTVDDLDIAELDRFRRLATGGGDAILAELSDSDLLSALGLRSVDGVPTLGAALLFGTADVLSTFAPTHAVVFQALDEHDAVQASESLPVPLLRAMLELAEAVNRYNPEEEIDDGLFRLGLPRYSQVAVRELIANALVHRDYSLNGQVRVAVEGTTLSVSSPGGFPDGITIDNLLTAPPQARNPLIADAFKRAGLVERTGRGVNRVYRHQLALGRPQPDYSRSTRAWVEAQVPAGAADRELAAFAAAAARDNNALNLQTLQVLHEVRAEGRITSVRAGELLHIPAEGARSVLNALVERGLLEARGDGKGRTYHLAAELYRQLGEPAAYVRTRGFDLIQQEQMVLTYVAEHGSIGRAEAAELCRLGPDQASRLLRRMVAAQALQMTGARRTARYHASAQDAAALANAIAMTEAEPW
ncbi:RNA-binding domain-containing protein [Candidatus Poriferisodalis sp.]|uniref:RNA-binding domain-containing protein n=1 Tax=Candidatus Poriferisodalis sp. TaxID=3101277 RepID=UPI003B596B65